MITITLAGPIRLRLQLRLKRIAIKSYYDLFGYTIEYD